MRRIKNKNSNKNVKRNKDSKTNTEWACNKQYGKTNENKRNKKTKQNKEKRLMQYNRSFPKFSIRAMAPKTYCLGSQLEIITKASVFIIIVSLEKPVDCRTHKMEGTNHYYSFTV